MTRVIRVHGFGSGRCPNGTCGLDGWVRHAAFGDGTVRALCAACGSISIATGAPRTVGSRAMRPVRPRLPGPSRYCSHVLPNGAVDVELVWMPEDRAERVRTVSSSSRHAGGWTAMYARGRCRLCWRQLESEYVAFLPMAADAAMRPGRPT